MVIITHIRTLGGPGVENITDVRWEETSSGRWGTSTRAQMVEFIERGHKVRVHGGSRQVLAVVVRADPPHIRTEADGRETPNLLALPRF